MNPHGDLIGINKFKEKWSKNITTEHKKFSVLETAKRRLLRNSSFVRNVRDNLRKKRNKNSKIYEKAYKLLKEVKD